MPVAAACPNPLAAQAAADIGAAGGNAIDAAVAAMLVTAVSEPGIVSLAGGAYVTVAPPSGPVVTVDGYVEMPGRGLPGDAFGRGLEELHTQYGGGTTMTIGPGSVATPGLLSGLAEAHRRYGALAWSDVLQPVIAVGRNGFPLGRASAHYLSYVRDSLFAHDPITRAAVHHRDGSPIKAGETMVIPDLAEFLELVATDGADALMRGEVAARLVERLQTTGGLITHDDLTAYAPLVRPAALAEVTSNGESWTLATNPPPAIGGPVLIALLLLLTGDDSQLHDCAQTVAVMRAVLRHRAERLDGADLDRHARAQALLDGVRSGGQRWLGVAPSTAHVSVVDADGAACAVTASSGYGSGITIPGTGVWLNNCLGEHELNRSGPHALPPGARLASNMAPTVARSSSGSQLAIGSPGADRITTAMAQVLRELIRGAEVQTAIDAPRMHIARDASGVEILHYESDLPTRCMAELPSPGVLARREHPAGDMYFGGVAVAVRHPDGRLVAAADPRRDGATHPAAAPRGRG